jgi:hypothetical protein
MSVMLTARVLLVGTAVTLGCGGHQAPNAAPEPNQTADIALVVTNHKWQDITVFASHDGVTERVGLVPVARTTTFTIPARMVVSQGPFYLTADPVGDPTPYTSDNILVRPGQEIVWILEEDLLRSSLSVY